MTRLGPAMRAATGIALVAVVLASLGVRAADAAARVASVPVATFALALALDLAGQTSCAWRWWRLARGPSPGGSFARFWSAYFSGMFFNAWLPTSIGGDVVRAWTASDEADGRTRALASVLVDRDVGLGALLCVGLATSSISGAAIRFSLAGQQVHAPVWVAFALLAACYLAINACVFHPGVSFAALRSVPGSMRERIAPLRNALLAYRAALRRDAIAAAFGVSIAYQMSEIALVTCLSRALGIGAPVTTIATMVGLQAVAGLLPITVNNLGVREAVLGAVLVASAGPAPDGAALERAVALSWAWLAVVLASGAVGGAVLALSRMPRAHASRSAP